MIRAQSIANPPLILLHGGPGLSETGLFRQTKASLCSAAQSAAATATCALVVDADDEATIRARLAEYPWPEDFADGREHPAVVGLASRVARELTATIADPAMRVAGFQLYTFQRGGSDGALAPFDARRRRSGRRRTG